MRRKPHTSRALEVVVVATALLLLGIWRWHLAFHKGLTLSHPGDDSTGTIGLIYELATEFRRQGLPLLWGDFFSPPGLGGGVYMPIPTNPLWRLQYCLLGQLLAPDNVYDVVLLLAYVGNGAAAFLLAREIGATRLAAAVAALAAASLWGFDARALMHNGLAFFFPAMVFAWTAVRAGKRPSRRRMIAFALGGIFSFLGNEYFGYFSAFFCTVLFLGYLAAWHGRSLTTRRALGLLASRSLLALGVLVVGMMVLYPTLFVTPLLARLGLQSVQPSPSPSHPDFDFELYAIKNPWALFQPGLPWLSSIVPRDVMRQAGTYEFTFPIGAVVPALGLLLTFALALVGRGRDRRRTARQAAVWCAAIAVVVSLSVAPSISWSLVPFTHRFAPMFRVGARATMLADVGFLMLLALGFGALQRRAGGRRAARATVTVAVVALSALALADLRPNAFWTPIRTYPLPRVPSAVSAAATLPPGFFAELPFFHHPPDRFENDLVYLFDRTIHHHPILNMMYSPGIDRQIVAIWDQLGRGGEDAIALLRHLGVRWVALHPDVAGRYLPSPSLTLARKGADANVYEVTDPAPLQRPAASTCLQEGLYCGGLLPTRVARSQVVASPVSPTVLAREAIVEPGFSGYLTYGPYVKLAPGEYETTFYFFADIQVDDGASLDVEIARDGGRQRLAAARALLPTGRLSAVTVRFVLTSDAEVEFRSIPHTPGRYVVDLVSCTRLN